MPNNDDEIDKELESSPTAQGDGPNPDAPAALSQPTDPSSLVAQPGDTGDAANVDINGNQAEIQMPEAPAGREAISMARKGMDPNARKNAVVPDQLGLQGFVDYGQKQDAAVDANVKKQQDASNQQAEITKQYDARDAELQQQINDENKLWAGVDERVAAQSAAESHKYIAAYESQKAAVRQMAVDPTGPIGSMTTAEAGGMSLANFAQGFLNARYGIKIDVAGQIDKWVERSIAEQQRKISQANSDADSQLHLLEISRQTSNDAAEARQRYRGLIIAGMQGSLTASAMQYKSDIATANAAAVNAQFEAEGIKSKQAIWNNVYSRMETAAQRGEQIRHDTALESLESRKLQIMADKQPKAPKAPPPLITIDDPESPGVPKWAVDPTDKEAVTAAKKSRAAVGTVMSSLNELQDAYNGAFKKYGHPESVFAFSDALASPEVRRYKRAQTEVALKMLDFGNSHRYSDNHLAELKKLIPGEKGWQRGDNADAIDALKEDVRSTFQESMNTFPTFGRGQTAMPKLNEKHDLRKAEAEAPPAVDTASGQEVALTSNESLNKPFEKPTQMWSKTMPGAQPMSAIAVDHLALAIANPKQFRSTHESTKESIPDDDKELREQSVKAIRQIEVKATDPQVRVYAHNIIEKYHEKGAAGLKELISEEANGED